MVRAALTTIVGAALAASVAGGATREPTVLPPGFTVFGVAPRGGSLWQGEIPNPFVPRAYRATVIYVPPEATPTQRYPVLYVLHGFRGSPYSIALGLHFAAAADAAIASHDVPPFIGVFPPAGRTPRYDGEWAGPWEKYVVQAVVPWVDTHLPSIPSRRARTLAGLSAGGYGAVDIGLRHPTVFGTLESWSGYFRAPRDGPLRFASETELEAHDPTLLAWSKAPALRSLATRFFLSCGTTADRDDAALAESFAGVLTSLRLPHELWLAPGGHDGKFWRRQLPAALRYAFPREL